MKLLARISGDEYGTREVVLLPHGRRYELQERPRPPLHALITVSMPGLATASSAAIQAWLAHESGEPGINALRRHLYRQAELADFMDAVNAEAHLAATADWNADALAAFVRTAGGELLAEVRAELEGATSAARVAARAQRFTQIVGIADAGAILDELGKLHEIEHLMALEHAIVRWIGEAPTVRQLELAALARVLPDEDASAGISDEWFGWWWRLARACTRGDLAHAVERVLAYVDRECTAARRSPVAAEARQSAREMFDRMQLARHARLWASPYDAKVVVKTVVRDTTDAHYTAFMAVSHAAHALAYSLSAQLSPAHANRSAMKSLARIALAAATAER